MPENDEFLTQRPEGKEIETYSFSREDIKNIAKEVLASQGSGTKLYKHVIVFDNPYTYSGSGGSIVISKLVVVNNKNEVYTDLKHIENFGWTEYDDNVSASNYAGFGIQVIGSTVNFTMSGAEYYVRIRITKTVSSEQSSGISVVSLGTYTDTVTEL